MQKQERSPIWSGPLIWFMGITAIVWLASPMLDVMVAVCASAVERTPPMRIMAQASKATATRFGMMTCLSKRASQNLGCDEGWRCDGDGGGQLLRATARHGCGASRGRPVGGRNETPRSQPPSIAKYGR